MSKVSVETKQIATIEDLQHMSPNKFASIGCISFPNPFNQNEIISGEFNIFDGVAFGVAVIDGKEREILMEYPLLNLINKTATNMKENIRAHLNIAEDRDVTIFEILSSYPQIKVIK